MNEITIKCSPNIEENILYLTDSTICNICISGLTFGYGQIPYTVDLSKDGTYVFSNGKDNGYVQYTLVDKKIRTIWFYISIYNI